MNYLAHSYLSFNHEEIIIGNFIADSIRGNNYLHLPKVIVNGILLHRKIDVFTDSHPIFLASKRRFSKDFDKYSGILMDIFYDHFLAKNFSLYSTVSLTDYSKNIYTILTKNMHHIPEPGQHFFKYMTERNVLVNYASIEGISVVLEHFSHRIKHRYQLNHAIPILKGNYQETEEEFKTFFEELKEYCLKQPEITEI